MAQKESIITINNMRKSYREVTILSGINLNIKKGEIFCLLGSNGAGKTTLINILSTLIKADAGTALVNGYELDWRTAIDFS